MVKEEDHNEAGDQNTDQQGGHLGAFFSSPYFEMDLYYGTVTMAQLL